MITNINFPSSVQLVLLLPMIASYPYFCIIFIICIICTNGFTSAYDCKLFIVGNKLPIFLQMINGIVKINHRKKKFEVFRDSVLNFPELFQDYIFHFPKVFLGPRLLTVLFYFIPQFSVLTVKLA